MIVKWATEQGNVCDHCHSSVADHLPACPDWYYMAWYDILWKQIRQKIQYVGCFDVAAEVGSGFLSHRPLATLPWTCNLPNVAGCLSQCIVAKVGSAGGQIG